MGLINQFLERKVMLVVYLQILGAAKISVLGCRGVLLSEARLYSYLIHCLSIKRLLFPLLYCVYLMYIGLMNVFNYIINMIFI